MLSIILQYVINTVIYYGYTCNTLDIARSVNARSAVYHKNISWTMGGDGSGHRSGFLQHPTDLFQSTFAMCLHHIAASGFSSAVSVVKTFIKVYLCSSFSTLRSYYCAWIFNKYGFARTNVCEENTILLILTLTLVLMLMLICFKHLHLRY